MNGCFVPEFLPTPPIILVTMPESGLMKKIVVSHLKYIRFLILPFPVNYIQFVICSVEKWWLMFVHFNKIPLRSSGREHFPYLALGVREQPPAEGESANNSNSATPRQKEEEEGKGSSESKEGKKCWAADYTDGRQLKHKNSARGVWRGWEKKDPTGVLKEDSDSHITHTAVLLFITILSGGPHGSGSSVIPAR